MATAAEALVWLMKSDPTIGGATGGRFYPNVAPEGSARPSIAWQQISDAPEMSHDGFSSLQKTRYQLTIEADTYGMARRLARSVKRLLNGYKGAVLGINIGYCTVENDMDDYSTVAMLPVARMDVLMTHDEQ